MGLSGLADWVPDGANGFCTLGDGAVAGFSAAMYVDKLSHSK